MDIAKCTWFNTSVYKFFKADFVLWNRTARVFNASWQQFVDLQNDVLLDIQVYKFMSNEYRFFPITVRVNTCAEYIRNTFRIKEILPKVSNIKPCNMKRGFYYIRNGVPDFSKFPPQLPRGMYKMVWTCTYHSYLLYELEHYGKIVDKPIDWRKIPKHNWDLIQKQNRK
ncbi:hypothetical protein ILUMI_10299 [Ignelater luminosus]|uniref:Uncharacterized protein n=1 Tax=Ignelater luminosus TaxID=2038154 RepID=A0A8K0GEA0_IGNLU|nr:hypothetical protein ILUMI_10299 [Ignelater luminosus]